MNLLTFFAMSVNLFGQADEKINEYYKLNEQYGVFKPLGNSKIETQEIQDNNIFDSKAFKNLLLNKENPIPSRPSNAVEPYEPEVVVSYDEDEHVDIPRPMSNTPSDYKYNTKKGDLFEGYRDNKYFNEIVNLPKRTAEEKDFLLKLAYHENRFNPTRSSKSGSYKGLYQFGPRALADIKMDVGTYMGDSTKQHEAALTYGNKNFAVLKPFHKYLGKVINGVKITKNGLMAAAHLGGVGNVRKFFTEGIDFKDANGTPISKYMKMYA